MMRFAIPLFVVVVVASSCSGGKKGGTTTGAGSGSGSGVAVLYKKVALSWGIQQGAGSAEIFLATTDETGRQVSHPISTFKGTCETHTPAAEMKAIIGLACRDGASTTEVHAVVQGGEVIVLKLLVQAGATPDPMERVEITRVTMPAGAAIVAG